jgi:hypothetical protein
MSDQGRYGAPFFIAAGHKPPAMTARISATY